VISGVVGVLILIGAIALYVAPVDVGKHWLWPLTPLLARAVASWYALFGTMLVSCAVGLRRRSEALIPYATLLCWCVLVVLIAPLNSGDVTGGGPWYTGMVALGLVASYGLRVAWPERADL
jgi:hypothetical protein